MLAMAEHEKRPPARLSSQDAALLSEQIGGLTRMGLPLAGGLEALGAELPRSRLKRTLDALARKLTQGATLDEAIAVAGRAVPAHLHGLVLAGQRTGRMGEILGRFAGYARIGVEVQRRLWLSLAYPAVAIAIATVLLLFVLLFVISGFEQIFEDFGLTLPLMTWLLVKTSSGLRQEGLPILAVLAIAGAIAALTMTAIGPAARRSMLSRLPLLGPVWKWTSLAEFCHLFGLLLESEVPLTQAVPMAAEGVVDADLRAALRSLSSDLDRGEPLARALGRRSYFPEGIGGIVHWAQEHRSLAEALHMLGEMFEARARSQATFASTVVTVLAVFMIVLGVGLGVLGIFIPLYQLLEKLSG
jgi:type II secretory pathway component PulF